MGSFLNKKKEPYETITTGLILRDGAEFDTEPRFRTLLLKGFIVYLVVMGSMGCLLSSFKIPYDAVVIHLAVFVGALFSAFLYYTKVWENVGYFVLFALMLGTGLLLRRYISSGFFAVVNIISERAAYYFDTEVVQGYAESIGNREVTVTIAFVYVGWVHAILLNALISRQMKYFAVMFASFFFLTVPFYLECEPDMLYILMLMAGCAIVFAFRGARHTPITKNDRRFEYLPKKRFINYVYAFRHHLKMVVAICALVAVAGGIFQLFVHKSDYELASSRGRSAWKQSTHDTVANIYKNGIWGLFNRYDSTGGLKSGVLGGVNSVTLDYETDLEVTYVPCSAERVYLRSFTGAKYLPFENRWERSAKALLYTDPVPSEDGQRMEMRGVRLQEATTSRTGLWLKKRYAQKKLKELDELRQKMKAAEGANATRESAEDAKNAESNREKYADLPEGYQAAMARMDVRNIAAGLGTFLPYYVDESDSLGLQMMNYRQNYELTYFPWLSDPGEVKTGKVEPVMDKNGKNIGRLMDQSSYVAVPQENQAVIDEFIREAGLEQYRVGRGGEADRATGTTASGGAVSAEQAGQTLALLQALEAYFQEHIPYSYSPGVTPRGKDFVNYFLADNKRGYCAHFASAATLILRRLGYPARYVEGYAIDPSDLSEDAKVREDLSVRDYYDGDNPLGEDSKVVTVSVTDAMAHAWVEVQVEGHWCVAELTPWSEEEPPSGGFLQGLIDFLSGTDSGSGSGGNEVAGGESGGAGLDAVGRILGYGFLILFAAAAVVLILILLIRLTRGRINYLRGNRSDRLVMDFARASRKADRLAAGKEEASESTVATGAMTVSINYRDRVEAMDRAGRLPLTRAEKQELVAILERAGFSDSEIDAASDARARELMKRKG